APLQNSIHWKDGVDKVENRFELILVASHRALACRNTSRSTRRSPLIGTSNANVDSGDTEVTFEQMTEEELLKGIERLALVPREEPQEELQEEDAQSPLLRSERRH